MTGFGVNELGLDSARQDARLVSLVEQELHGAPSGVAVAARPVVDVHAHEAVGALRIVLQAAGVAGGVAEGLLAMIERIFDTLCQQSAQTQLEVRVEIAADENAGAKLRKIAGQKPSLAS